MKSQSFTEIDIFNAALEIRDPEQRAHYLAEACADNRHLLTSVQSLLQAYDRGIGTFESLIPSVPTRAKAIDLPPGEMVGPYRIVEKLGEGGCGTVYVAEQQVPVRRRVALKVIKAGMDTRSVIARFEAERQALAMMDHPNIAKVFEAGSTAQGRPYFAMELVQGEQITSYCDSNKLSIEARLRLLATVCDAVQHAHQKAIIHRDLKPSNILVVGSPLGPIPKIIDFGIAKAVSGRLTDATYFTRVEQLIGTPAYMSPEQALLTSEDIDTRTDIYSLGILSYELLTGQPPFNTQELLAAGLDEMRRIIREVEPQRPSVAARRSNPGEGIVTASSQAEGSKPRRRDCYREQIEADLDWIVLKCLEKDRSRRYATANGLAAEIHRYLKNEPLLARPPAATYRVKKFIQRNKIQFASGVLLVLALLAGLGLSTWQAARATRAERKAQAFVDVLLQGIAAADIFRMEKPDIRSMFLLEKVAEQLDKKLTVHPLAEAKIRMTLAAIYAKDQLPHLARAYELRREVLGLTHTDTLQAIHGLACYYITQYRFAEAEALLRQVQSVPVTAPDSLGAAYVLAAEGYLARIKGQNDEAIKLLRRAVASFEKHPDAAYVEQAFFDLGWSLIDAKRWEAAEEYITQLVKRYEQRAPGSLITANARKVLAYLHLNQGKTDSAIEILEQVRPVIHENYKPPSGALVDIDWMLGWAYEQQGRTNDAVRIYAGLTPHWHGVAPEFQHTCAAVAAWLFKVGAVMEAQATYEALHQSFEKVPPMRSANFIAYLQAIGAKINWNSAAAVCRTSQFNDSLWMCLNKAWLLRFTKDESAYQQIVRTALGVWPDLAPDEEHLPIEIAALGDASLSAEERQQLTSRMAELRARLSKRPEASRMLAYRAISHLQFRFGNYGEALESLAAFEQLQKTPDAYASFLRAACLHRLGRHREAQMAFDEGSKASHPEGIAALERYVHLVPLPDLFQKLTMYREVGAMLKETESGAVSASAQ